MDMLTEATAGSETCTLISVTTDNPDPDGSDPGGVGSFSAQLDLSLGGPNLPTGDCIIMLQASGSDGISISARRSHTLSITANEIDTHASIAVPLITVRESKLIAGIDENCFKWTTKQHKARAKCNFILLVKGSEAATKCKDAGPEPPSCDPGNFAEAILALSHGMNDQQVDPLSAELIDRALLKDQLKCQKKIGFAAAKFAKKRLNLVQKRCVALGIDSQGCRDQQTTDTQTKLNQIDKCVTQQLVDPSNGRIVPDLDPPCEACIDGGGVLDRKCLKNCFLLELSELTDGIIGDIAECGNGIVQPGEFCDDANLTNGDCCSATCTAENLGDQSCGVGACEVIVAVCENGAPLTCTPGAPATEGPMGDASCSDGIDNDCDTFTDAADVDCQP